MRRLKIYGIWNAMKRRCFNKNSTHFSDYGGRGITVCERWMEFENFFADMGYPQQGFSLDRFPDNNGNYEPGNCRWASKKEQSLNRRNNRIIAIDGMEKPMSVWSEISGIKVCTIWARLSYGWSNKDAVFLPLVKNRKGVTRKQKLHDHPLNKPEQNVRWTDPGLYREAA